MAGCGESNIAVDFKRAGRHNPPASRATPIASKRRLGRFR
jgi:hypothetical protein